MTHRLILLAFVGALGLSGPAHAQFSPPAFSPEQARDARAQGEIKPLKEIFKNLKRRYGGYQVEAELFSAEGGGYEYHISWITGDGRKIDLVVDAVTGEIKSERGA